MDLSVTAARLERELRARAEREYGPERARTLADAIGALAESLALIASIDLELEDAEPDFVD